jgi:hypothetical protein
LAESTDKEREGGKEYCSSLKQGTFKKLQGFVVMLKVMKDPRVIPLGGS